MFTSLNLCIDPHIKIMKFVIIVRHHNVIMIFISWTKEKLILINKMPTSSHSKILNISKHHTEINKFILHHRGS